MRMFLSQLQNDDPRTAPKVAAQQLNTKTVKHADGTKNVQGLANLLLATAKPSGLSCSSKGTHQDAQSIRNHGTVKKQTPNHIVYSWAMITAYLPLCWVDCVRPWMLANPQNGRFGVRMEGGFEAQIKPCNMEAAGLLASPPSASQINSEFRERTAHDEERDFEQFISSVAIHFRRTRSASSRCNV
jgi:hypothetical protein